MADHGATRKNALIVVHYDGLVRSSEIKIQSLSMWVCFYNLPQAMMKEAVAMQPRGQLGKYIKVDCRYSSYVRVIVDYPLEKPLMPQLMIKIMGGLMPDTLCYENVPHFLLLVRAHWTCNHELQRQH
jgi:hypothetical protein